MDHLRFKSNQTAAAYVADALDREVQEAFELHLMSCPECVDEVEGWRAIKGKLGDVVPEPRLRDAPAGIASRREAAREPRTDILAGTTLRAASAPEPLGAAATAQYPKSAAPWKLAALLAGVAAVGAGGGWYARLVQGPSLDTDSVSFYSMPPLTRGPADCTVVAVGSHTRMLAIRLPDVGAQEQLSVIDSEGHELDASDAVARPQGDGSWVVRLRATVLRDQGIRFESRSLDGTVEPRGCLMSSSGG